MSSPENCELRSPDELLQTGRSVYEQTREERIKANLERMQKLGLKDLSLNLSSTSRTRNPKPRSYVKYDEKLERLPSPLPLRRSSRLQKVDQPSYNEKNLSKNDAIEEEGLKCRKREVYSEEYAKRLGGTERSWTLFVDGYGKDGRRIYDSVKGKTCHQCRQKTLGHRTHCSECQMVQGQFCGDCLYMRYGEHVLEALENPNWTCPVCRGICNCSLCRQSKGLAPTGILYRKITQLGYKSVAHYLIETKRPENNTANSSDEPLSTQASAKRSLPFSNSEGPPNSELHNVLKIEEQKLGCSDTPLPHTECELHDVALIKTDQQEEVHKLGSDTPVANREKKTSPCSSFSNDEAAGTEYPDFVSATPPKSEVRRDKRKGVVVEEEELDGKKRTANPSRSKKNVSSSAIEAPDSVGARVRQRRRTTINVGE